MGQGPRSHPPLAWGLGFSPQRKGEKGAGQTQGVGRAHALISSCRWIRSLQRSRYLDWVALYSVITSTNFRESVECWGRSGGTAGKQVGEVVCGWGDRTGYVSLQSFLQHGPMTLPLHKLSPLLPRQAPPAHA